VKDPGGMGRIDAELPADMLGEVPHVAERRWTAIRRYLFHYDRLRARFFIGRPRIDVYAGLRCPRIAAPCDERVGKGLCRKWERISKDETATEENSAHGNL